ncbi:MAG: FAD-dependent oxidoreductase, partial [Paracoccaceae bacterium]|nr:FAD-dependent oxidoreductase [Paracoccaceae bacterium]
MQGRDFPLTQDLVLIGGGHAHALVLRMWGMEPLPGVRLTVINPGPVAPYTGMLPGHIAGHYTRAEMMIDLVTLARFAGARVILDRVVGIDRTAGRVVLEGRAPVAYDLASIDIGIGSDLPKLPGFAEHAVAAKPLGAYADRWQGFVAAAHPTPRLVVIGAGVGGIELAMASAHRLRGLGAEPQVTVLEQSANLLPGIGTGARAALGAHMARLGVQVLTGARPARIEAGQVVLEDGRILPSDFTLSVAGARPQGWLATTGLALEDGFIRVSPTLQSSDPAIFAAGDCAYLTHAPRPKAGVFAVREAPVLLHNLRAALSGQGQMRSFHPQSDYLKLVSTGGRGAVA